MIRPIAKTALALVFGTALAAPVLAGESADLAAEAEEMAAAGNTAEAIETMREAYLTLLAGLPLTFTEVVFVTEEPQGYGVYSPRDNNIFAKDEPLLVYTEPAGFGWDEQGETYHSELVVDFEIRTPEGAVLGGQKGFGRFAFDSLAQNTEYMARVSISLTGAEPGSYLLGLTFHDTVDGDETELELPFEIQ